MRRFCGVRMDGVVKGCVLVFRGFEKGSRSLACGDDLATGVALDWQIGCAETRIGQNRVMNEHGL